MGDIIIRPHRLSHARAGSSRAGRLRATTTLRVLGWAAVLGLAVYFAQSYALRFFHPDAATYGPYWWPRAPWLLPHVGAGMVTLFLGPVQFWSAFRRRYARLHWWVGRAYLVGVGVGAATAAVMVTRTGAGLVFAWGLAGLATAWVLTSGLAVVAIRRGNVAQHREWMVRSYVVTFAFVLFRVQLEAMNTLGIGETVGERAALASWFSWALPLLVTEVVLQGRKVLRTPRRALPAFPN